VSTGLNFTTLARVKALIGETTSDQDVLLDALIAATSARIEDEMGRKAKKQAYTEVYPLSEARHVLMLRAAPIDVSQAITVKASASMDFSGSAAMTTDKDFVVDPFTTTLRFPGQFVAPRRPGAIAPSGPIYMQVAYTGGMAETTAEFIQAYPDIATAADLQASYLHRRRLSPGGNVTVGSGSTSFEKQYGLLDEVRALIARHRRSYWN
jgi:hypothetical protein